MNISLITKILLLASSFIIAPLHAMSGNNREVNYPRDESYIAQFFRPARMANTGLPGRDTDIQGAWGLIGFLYAAETGGVQEIRRSIAGGMDVNAQAPDGSTALAHAASFGQTQVVRVLLENGAQMHVAPQRDVFNREQQTSFISPLLCAAYHGHEEVVRLLFDHGLSIRYHNDMFETIDIIARNNRPIRNFLRVRACIDIAKKAFFFGCLMYGIGYLSSFINGDAWCDNPCSIIAFLVSLGGFCKHMKSSLRQQLITIQRNEDRLFIVR